MIRISLCALVAALASADYAPAGTRRPAETPETAVERAEALINRAEGLVKDIDDVIGRTGAGKIARDTREYVKLAASTRGGREAMPSIEGVSEKLVQRADAKAGEIAREIDFEEALGDVSYYIETRVEAMVEGVDLRSLYKAAPGAEATDAELDQLREYTQKRASVLAHRIYVDSQRESILDAVASRAWTVADETPRLVLKRKPLARRVVRLGEAVIEKLADSPKAVAELKKLTDGIRNVKATAEDPYASPLAEQRLLRHITELLRQNEIPRPFQIQRSRRVLLELVGSYDDDAAELNMTRSTLRGKVAELADELAADAIAYARKKTSFTDRAAELLGDVKALPVRSGLSSDDKADIRYLERDPSEMLTSRMATPAPFNRPAHAGRLLTMAGKLLDYKESGDEAAARLDAMEEKGEELQRRAAELTARKDDIKATAGRIAGTQLYKAVAMRRDRRKKLNSAMTVLEDLVTENPEVARAHYLRAKAAWNYLEVVETARQEKYLKDRDAAIKEALRYDSDDYDINMLAGRYELEKASKADKAREYFNTALKQRPYDIAALEHLYRALAFITEENPEQLDLLEDLISRIDKAARYTDTPSKAYLLAGRVHRLYARVLEETDENWQDDEELSKRIIRHGIDSVEQIEKMETLPAGYDYALLYMASLLSEAGREDEAIRTLTERIKNAPDEEWRSRITVVLGSAYLRQHRVGKAREVLRSYIESDKKHAGPQSRLAVIEINLANVCERMLRARLVLLNALAGRTSPDEAEKNLNETAEYIQNAVPQAYLESAGLVREAEDTVAMLKELTKLLSDFHEFDRELTRLRRKVVDAARRAAVVTAADAAPLREIMDKIALEFSNDEKLAGFFREQDLRSIRRAFEGTNSIIDHLISTVSPIKRTDIERALRDALLAEADINGVFTREDAGKLLPPVHTALNRLARDASTDEMLDAVEKALPEQHPDINPEILYDDIRKRVGDIRANWGEGMADKLARQYLFFVETVDSATKTDAFESLTSAAESARREAIRHLHDVVAREPHRLPAYRLLSRQYEHLDRFDDAQRHLRRALGVDSEQAIVSGRPEEERVRQIQRDCAYRLALLYRRRERQARRAPSTEKALRAAETAIDRDPHNPELYLLAGRIAAAAHKHRQARGYLHEALSRAIVEKLEEHTPPGKADKLLRDVEENITSPGFLGSTVRDLEEPINAVLKPEGAQEEFGEKLKKALRELAESKLVMDTRRQLVAVARREIASVNGLLSRKEQLTQAQKARRIIAVERLLGNERAVADTLWLKIESQNEEPAEETESDKRQELEALDQAYYLADACRGAAMYIGKQAESDETTNSPDSYFRRAEQHLDKICKVHKQAVSAFVLNAMVYDRLGRTDEAIGMLNKAVNIKPEDALCLIADHNRQNRAKLRREPGFFDKTLSDARALLAWTYIVRKNDPEKARPLIEQVRRQDPDHPYLLWLDALGKEDAGEKQEGLEHAVREFRARHEAIAEYHSAPTSLRRGDKAGETCLLYPLGAVLGRTDVVTPEPRMLLDLARAQCDNNRYADAVETLDGIERVTDFRPEFRERVDTLRGQCTENLEKQ